ncbi:MAG: hypothetical protein ACOXZI_06045 [Candidatus Cryptobacteroides sp.]|jgi:hypothetical protein
MKKYIYILIAAAAVMACQKEKINVGQELPVQGNKVEFTATVESAASKAIVASASEFTWEASDKAALITTNGIRLELAISNISGKSATFTANVPDSDSITEGTLVVYPASLLNNDGTVTFPTSYTNGKGADGPALAAKVSSTRTLDFKYLAGTIKFTIADVPAIATSIDVKARNSDDNADFTCTGTYTVDFSGATPSLIGETTPGSSVSISGLVAGSNTVSLPLPRTGDQKVVVSVKYNTETLFTKSVTLSGTKAVTRNFYAAMPALNINPEVYIIGDRIGWNTTDAPVAAVLGSVASTDFTVLRKRYFRAIVKYGDFEVNYGFAELDVNAGANGTLVAGQSNAPFIAYSGVYTITFDYTSGAYTVTKTATSPLYMIGVNNVWAFDSSTNPFTVIPNTNLLYWKGTSTHTEYKVYEYGITGWDVNYAYGSNYKGNLDGPIIANGSNCGNGDNTEGCAVFDFRGYRYVYGKTAEGATSVVLMGVDNDWTTGISLTKIENTRIWHKTNVVVATNAEVKFVENGSVWYGYGTNYNMGANPDRDNLSTSGNNMILPAGTYDIYYIDIYHSYHIYAR